MAYGGIDVHKHQSHRWHAPAVSGACSHQPFAR
jgi:hypothetical protein